jgi:hypothetical protein
MAPAKREDERLLSKEEQNLVAQTRHPNVKGLAGHDLLEIIKQLRDRRDRAREFGRYKRRELRSQRGASGRTVSSMSAALESDGHRAKRTLLSGALKRANKETERRRVMDARSANVSNARRALAMKKAAETDTQWPPSTRTAHEGMQPIPNSDIAPSGALGQEGQRVVLERSRKVR